MVQIERERGVCRGLEPVIFRLRGKGIFITLARMDQFIYNLGLDLLLYKRYMAPPEVYM